MDQPRRWLRIALLALPIALCGGCGAMMAAGVFVACSAPPPLGPLSHRLPADVELIASENWCGDDAAEDYFWRAHHCVRALVVTKSGTTAEDLVEELRGAYGGPEFAATDADHYFMIMPEADAWSGRPDSDTVAVIQARGC